MPQFFTYINYRNHFFTPPNTLSFLFTKESEKPNKIVRSMVPLVLWSK